MSDVPEQSKNRFEQYQLKPDTEFIALFPAITLAVEKALAAQQAESKVTTSMQDELQCFIGPRSGERRF